MLRRIEGRATHPAYLVSLIVDHSTVVAVHGVGSCNTTLHCTCLSAKGINCLPDILVQCIAVDASREWEEQQRGPPHRSDQAASKIRIIEPVRLPGGDADTIRGSGDTHTDTMADAPAAVAQKTNLYKNLVALAYFLRYGASPWLNMPTR